MSESPSQPASSTLAFVKLGGSLITDKSARETAREATIARLASEIRAALDAAPGLRLVLGHGSGSFGHWEADEYGTRAGVASPGDWHGFARVSATALRLNRIVTEQFIEAGVPVLSVQPSATALAQDGEMVTMNVAQLHRALDRGLVPLVFGDVAFDEVRGGTILSTEAIFAHLARAMHPTHILLLGNTPGVLDSRGDVIPAITPLDYPQVERHLRESQYTDVTGGMADKVREMLALVEAVAGLRVTILSGHEPGSLRRALAGAVAEAASGSPDHQSGTLIHAPLLPPSP
jgi:isopentenyl phosphate kinase